MVVLFNLPDHTELGKCFKAGYLACIGSVVQPTWHCKMSDVAKLCVEVRLEGAARRGP